MNILVTNANHFFGQAFLQSLYAQHNLWLLDHQEFHRSSDYFPRSRFLEGTAGTNGPWIEQLPQRLDAVFNLSLHSYFTDAPKRQVPKKLYETTINLVRLAQKKQARYYQIFPQQVFSSSAIHKIHPHTPLEERSQFAEFYRNSLSYLQKMPNCVVAVTGVLYNSNLEFFPSLPKLQQFYLCLPPFDNQFSVIHTADATKILLNHLFQNSPQAHIHLADTQVVTQAEFIGAVAYLQRTKMFKIPFSIPASLSSLYIWQFSYLLDHQKYALDINYSYPTYKSGFGIP
jgi:dTDP-4-dehydrorhamnose reductase